MKRFGGALAITVLVLVPLGGYAAVSHREFHLSAPFPPEFAVTLDLQDPSGDGILDPGEEGILVIRVENRGKGDGLGVFLIPTTPKESGVNLPEKMALGDIPAGSEKVGRLGVSVSPAYGKKELQVAVEVGEEPQRAKATAAITLSFGTRPNGSLDRREPTDSPKVSDVDMDVPRGKLKRPDAIAVVIGNWDYKGDVNRVKFAKRDADSIQIYLSRALGVEPGNVIRIDNASKGDFEGVFGNRDDYRGILHGRVKAKNGKADVFVYYSGHGAPDPENRKAFLVPVDAAPSTVTIQGYPLDLLYGNLKKLPARSVTVILDACFSGGSDEPGGGWLGPVSPLVVTDIPQGDLNILSAARGDQTSCWFEEERHSLFTYWFLKGIRGEADLAPIDSSVTIGELRDFLADKVPQTAWLIKHRSQDPVVTGKMDTVMVQY